MKKSKMLFVTTVLFFSFSFALTGCGWKTDGGERMERLFPEPVVDGDTDTNEAPVDNGNDGNGDSDDPDNLTEQWCGEAVPESIDKDFGEIEAEGIAGKYVAMMTLNGDIHAPAYDPWPLVITNLFIAEIDEAEETLTMRFCDQIQAVDSGSELGQVDNPMALNCALFNEPIEIQLDGDGTLSALDYAWLWGLQDMDDPFADALPESAGDDRVFDQDDDGYPGVTVQVFGPEGFREMVRRSIWHLEEAEMSDDMQWITQKLTFELEQVSVGAHAESLVNEAMLKVPAPITSREEGNELVFRRYGTLEDDSYFSCGDLIRDYQAIFGE